MANNNVAVRISGENVQFLRKMQECISELKKLDTAIKNTGSTSNQIKPPTRLLEGFSKAAAAGATVYASLMQIKDVAASIVMPGFNYTKEMETAQISIAGILTSMTKLDGKAMDFGSAMGISSDILKKLQKDAVLTGTATEEMVSAFGKLLAPGLDAGMNVNEIEEFTKVGVSAAKAMGLNSTQMVQELRSLVQGGVASGSTLAASLGLTDADIQAAKASSEGLFAFLMERMQGVAPMADAFSNTLEGKIIQIKELSTLASASITEAFTPEIKAAMDLVMGIFGAMNKEAGEFEPNSEILEFVDMIKSGADHVIELFGQMNEKGQFELNPETIDFFDGLGNGIRAVWDLLESLGSVIDTVFNNASFSLVADYWIPVLADVWSMVVDVVDIITSAITVIDNLGNAVLGVIAPFQKEFAGAIMWAVEKLKEFIHISKLGWDMLVKLSGGVPSKADNSKRINWQNKSEAQERKTVDRSGITARAAPKAAAETAKQAAMEAEKERKDRIKASQDALKEMLKYWKNQLDDIQREFKAKQEALKLRLDQGKISKVQYLAQDLQNDIAEKDTQIKLIEGRIKSTQDTEYDKPTEKQSALNDLNRERDLAAAEMKALRKASNEMTRFLEKTSSMTAEQAIKKYNLNPAGFEPPNGMGAMYQHALQAAIKIGVPTEWIYAQWSHESNKFSSRLAKENNNFGGLTQAENNGEENKQPDGEYYYMNFASPEKYADYFARYIKKYYPDAANAKTVEAYVSALKNGGYFGDSYGNYLSGVKAQMKNPAQSPAPNIDGEGKTWYKVESENPKYNALEGNAKQALEQVASYFNKLTGQQLGLTSGKRSAELGYAEKEIGGHYTGMKFDAVAEALKDPEIRRKVIDFAKRIGIDVLDEYADPTTNASGQHLDFNAANFKAKSAVGSKEPDDEEFETRQAYEAFMAYMELREKAKGFLKQYQGLMGDISSYQIEEITKQYKAIRSELEQDPNNDKAREALQVIDALEVSDKAKVNFAQTQKDLEKANADLADAQAQLFSEFEAGSKSSAQVADAYAATFHAMMDKPLQELQKQLQNAINRNDEQAIRDIRNKMRDVLNTMVDGFKALLDKIDAQTDEEIRRIQLRKDLTSGQKDDLIDATRQKGLRSKIAATEKYIAEQEDKRSTQTDQKAIEKFDQEIAIKRKQLEQFNYELQQTPTFIDEINLAGKQGLEDGFSTFFSDLTTGCKSAGQAFQDLANSILQSILKVITNRLTQQLINMLFPSSTGSGRPSIDGTPVSGPLKEDGSFFASGGDINGGGKVLGPGTGTSDSILAWSDRFQKFIGISDGEYVISAAAVRQWGTRFFDYVNSGMIPPEIYNIHEKYVGGGSLAGASYSATNSVNVPVSVSGFGNPAMSSELRNEIEDTVVRVIRKYS